MKNFFHLNYSLVTTILLLFFLTGFPAAKGQNPIPSYNVSVLGDALFVEPQPQLPAGKTRRTLNASASCTNTGETNLDYTTVYVATVDRQTILGPYTLYCGQTLSVEIDDRQWGVLVTTQTEMLISVWIDESKTATPPLHMQPFSTKKYTCSLTPCEQTFVPDNQRSGSFNQLLLPSTNSSHYEKYFLKVAFCINHSFYLRTSEMAINIKTDDVEASLTYSDGYGRLNNALIGAGRIVSFTPFSAIGRAGPAVST